jgi:hypothetical protein
MASCHVAGSPGVFLQRPSTRVRRTYRIRGADLQEHELAEGEELLKTAGRKGRPQDLVCICWHAYDIAAVPGREVKSRFCDRCRQSRRGLLPNSSIGHRRAHHGRIWKTVSICWFPTIVFMQSGCCCRPRAAPGESQKLRKVIFQAMPVRRR